MDTLKSSGMDGTRRLSNYSAVVLTIVWPGDDSGGAVALRSSLDQYRRVFRHVHYVALVDRPAHPGLTGAYDNVTFHHVPIVRQAPWLRFAKSMLSLDPAVTVFMKGRKAYRQIEQILDDALATGDGNVLGIVDCVSPGIHLPRLKNQFPRMKWIFRSSDVLVRAFAPFVGEGSAASRLAWRWEMFRIRRFEQMVADECDFYWCITAEDAIDSERAFGRKPAGVLSVDINPSQFASVAQGDLNTIIYLGTADVRKSHGIRSFITHCWPRLRAIRPDARLILGGRGTQAFNNPQEGIHGEGFVDDANRFLSQGFIFFNPQQAGSGIKVKSLNAMAAGKLLISSENGVHGIGGRSGEHYLVGETPDALVEAVKSVWDDADKAETIAANGRRLVEREFSSEAVTDSFDELIAQVEKELS